MTGLPLARGPAATADPFRLGLVAPRIHFFQLVARLGSIRQAAKSLNVAPSSVSRIVKALEDEVGTPLFERTRQRLKLTSAGELLLYHARQSTGEFARALTEINDLRGLNRGALSVATVESVARNILPDALQEFWTRYPLISVDVRVVGSQAACDAIAEGECDLAVAFNVKPQRNVRRIAAVSMPLGVVAHPGSRLAGRDDLRLFDLAGEQLLLSDATLALGVLVDEAIGRSLLDVSRRSRTNSIALMTALVKADAGISLQTRTGLETELAEGSLVFLPLNDTRLQPHRLMLLARPEREMSDAASAFGMQLSRRLAAFAA